MDTTLFRRLVAGIPQTTDTWSERARQDHGLEDFLPYSACHERGILSIFLPADSSHLTQPLDVGLFAIHKSAVHRVRPPSWMSLQTAQLMRILGVWQAVAMPPNIISSFTQTGLHSSWDQEHGALVISVDLETARRFEHERTVDESRRQKLRINLRF
jgi:hypothetical protein